MISASDPAAAAPASVDDLYQARGRHPERHRPDLETVTRLEPDDIGEYEGLHQTIGAFHHAFLLTQDDGGTRVTRTAWASFQWRLLRPLVYRTLVPHMLDRDLKALKECVEADLHRPEDITNTPTES